MNIKKFALLGVFLALLSACSRNEVLVAKPGQIGSGATITRSGASAQLMVPPSPKWPDGWNEAHTVEEAGGHRAWYPTAPLLQDLEECRDRVYQHWEGIRLSDLPAPEPSAELAC